jgi:hypothetical protein
MRPSCVLVERRTRAPRDRAGTPPVNPVEMPVIDSTLRLATTPLVRRNTWLT